MRYDQIHANQIHAAWPRVRVGLERIREKFGVRWLPEDIYSCLRSGVASLYLASGERSGFFILEIPRDKFSNEPYLNIWALYADKGQDSVEPFIADCMGFIDGIAKANNVKTITIEGRPGWTKYLKGYFAPRVVHYERKL